MEHHMTNPTPTNATPSVGLTLTIDAAPTASYTTLQVQIMSAIQQIHDHNNLRMEGYSFLLIPLIMAETETTTNPRLLANIQAAIQRLAELLAQADANTSPTH